MASSFSAAIFAKRIFSSFAFRSASSFALAIFASSMMIERILASNYLASFCF